MDENDLRRIITRPEVHRAVLAGYDGPYSLGIGQDSARKRPVLVLMVEDASEGQFPSTVQIEGEAILVRVESGYKTPLPL